MFSNIAIVLATYNERKNIERMLPLLVTLPLNVNVVIVDDGSPDRTGQAVKDFQTQYPDRIHLIERPGKMGYGSAFVVGFSKALSLNPEVIVSMDADFSHDPQSIPAMVARLADCDLAIGSRYINGIRILNWSMKRLLLSHFANVYVNTILNFKIMDCTSGFRAYRADVLRQLNLNDTSSQGYCFLVEVLENVVQAGFNVQEVPIVYTERQEGASKMSQKVIREAMLRPIKLKIKRLLKKQ